MGLLRRPCRSTAVWAWKSKDQNTMQKHQIGMCSIVQPPQKNYGGSFVRGPVPYSPDVPLKLNMDMAKAWRK